MTKGFTLIELLVIIAIMAIIAMVAMPSFTNTPEQRLDVVQREFTTAITHAMFLARTKEATHGVIFDVGMDRFAVVDGTGTPVIDPLMRRDYIVDFSRPDQPSNVDITGADFGTNGPAAIFAPGGTPDVGGSLSVSCSGHTRSLTIDGQTGVLTAN